MYSRGRFQLKSFWKTESLNVVNIISRQRLIKHQSEFACLRLVHYPNQLLRVNADSQKKYTVSRDVMRNLADT